MTIISIYNITPFESIAQNSLTHDQQTAASRGKSQYDNTSVTQKWKNSDPAKAALIGGLFTAYKCWP